MLGDLNEEIEEIVRRYGVPVKNKSDEKLLEMCAEHELMVGNSFFREKDVYTYTEVRIIVGRRLGDKELLDDMLLAKMMSRRVF